MRFLSALVALLAIFAPRAGAGTLRVVAATTDLGAIAEAVGGDRVHIDVVARPDRNPHAVQVRPSAMRDAARADVYLEVGLSLDLWSRGIVSGSRNRDLVVVDCSSVIRPLDVPTGAVSKRMGDVHPEGNPHYWVDPLNAVAVAEMLAERFATLDGAGAEAYRQGARAFAERVEARLDGWRAALANVTLVEYHTSWRYLAERFGVRIAGSVEPLPGIPPSARHLAELTETIEREGVSVVVREPYHPSDPVELLTRETGVRGIVLASSCPEPTADSYLDHMEEVVRRLGGGPPEGAGVPGEGS